MNPPENVPGAGAADNIVLIGPMGAGKSSIARELSRLEQRRWVDTDRLVVHDAGMEITEIFSTRGEAVFRELETAALRSLSGSRRLTIATGGGIVNEPANRDLLQALGCVVWLTADESVLFERVSRTGKRPLLHTPDPRATLHDLLEHRRPLYAGCAHVTVDTSTHSHPQVAETVLSRVRDFFISRETARTRDG